MKVLIWVQHLRGIGHLRRMSLIADALGARGAVVTLVSGGLPVPEFESGAFTLRRLGPVRARDATYAQLIDEAERPVDNMRMAARRRDLLAALRETAPDVVITELFPFGRRKFSYELLPFLTAARDRRRPPLIISSVRDILEPPSDPARRNESIRWANDHFDALLAHGDPDFLTLDVSMSETPCLRLPVLYTGYVAATTSPGGHEEYRTVVPEVLVSAGGGRSGGRLLQSAEGAALLIAGRVRLRWRLVSGPNGERPLHEQSRAYHSGSEIIRERRRDDMPALMAGAALSVSRAGYNTVAEALAAHTRMVLVPDTEGGQREQMLRARHLEERGLARYLTGSALTPENLAEAVLTHLDTPPPLHNVKLDGAAETARLIARLWQQYHAEGGLARHGEAR